MRAIPAVAALVIAACATASSAQQDGGLKGMTNPNAPIEVSADHFEADANSKSAIYSGNVIVRQGDVRMHTDWSRLHLVDNKPDKLYAQGHVVIDAPSGTATGDNGVYDVNPRIVTLSGNVVLIRDKDVMRGSQLTVNLVTGVVKLVGAAEQGGRVQGLFHPQESTTQTPATTSPSTQNP